MEREDAVGLRGVEHGLFIDTPTLGEQPGGFDTRAVIRHWGPSIDQDLEELQRRRWAPGQRLFPKSVSVPAGVATLALERNLRRIAAALNNVDTAHTVYFGDRGDVTVGVAGEDGAGFPIPPGAIFTFGKEYVGPLWLVSASTLEVRVLEIMTM